MYSELVLKGPPSDFQKIDLSLGEFFLKQAERFGDKVFQIDGNTGKQETYEEVKRKSIRVAVFLRQHGLKAKDVVLVCCRNNVHNIIPVLAAQYLGAYVSCVDPKHSVKEVKHAIEMVNPKVIFSEAEQLDLIENSLKDGQQQSPLLISIGSASSYPNMLDIETSPVNEADFMPEKVKSTETACILLSSGSTSLPKGICLTHWGLLNSAQLLLQYKHLQGDVLMHNTSLFWSTAWVFTTTILIKGGTKVVASLNGAEHFLQLVDKYKINFAMATNTFTYLVTNLDKATVAKYDTSSLRCLIIGGSAMNPNQILNFRRYLPHTNINLCYGSTEGSVIVIPNYDDAKQAMAKVSSSGRPAPDLQLKFVDLDTEELLGANQTGEILLKSPYAMRGYYDQSKNADVFDAEGFFRTGDVGYYDADGYVYVTDRVNDVFKYRTDKISPIVLEEALLEHPAVAEAVVFGVPHDVDRNHAAACVVLKPGKNPTEKELINFVDSRVPDACRLRGGLMMLDKIPTTVSGKYGRRLVRDQFIAARKPV